MSKQRPIDLNPDVDAPPAIAEAEPIAEPAPDLPRGRQAEAPPCQYCGQPCKAGSSTPFFTYYYCTNDDCPVATSVFRQKKPRPQIKQAIRDAAADEDFSAR